MKIEAIDDGFVEYLDNTVIDRIICKYNNGCTILFRDNSSKYFDINSSSYNRQYGIPVSGDGKKLFFCSWEKGMFAYDTVTGKIIWINKAGRIRNVLVYANYILVSRANRGVYKIDIETGQNNASIISKTVEHIFNLEYPYVFCETISGKYCIIDIEKMSVIKTYSTQIINPNRCLSLIITDVYLSNNKIIVEGFEGFPKSDCNISCLADGSRFKREIEPCFNAVHVYTEQ